MKKDVELDVGFSNFAKGNIGLSEFFTGLRFFALNRRLFINTYGSLGDNKEFLFEANYLLKPNVLLDYTYKRNLKLNNKVHYILLNKKFSDQFQGSMGFKYKDNNEEIFLCLNAKKYFWKNYYLNMKTDVK